MASLKAGSYYALQCRRGGNYLNVKAYDFSYNMMEMYDLQSKGDSNRDSQLFHVFRLDDGTYLLTNKRSGLSLCIRDNQTDEHRGHDDHNADLLKSAEYILLCMVPFASYWLSKDWFNERALDLVCNSSCQGVVVQRELKDADAASLTWKILNHSGPYHTIVNKKSDIYMNPQRHHARKTVTVAQNNREGPANIDNQLWQFHEEQGGKYSTTIPAISPQDIGDIFRPKSYSPPSQRVTKEVLVAQMLIPFPFINDNGLSSIQKSKESPMYTVQCYGFWKMDYFYDHDGGSATTKKVTYTAGLTTNNAEAVEKTTSMSVTAEGSFVFKGFSASLSTTISRELKVTISSSTTKENSKSMTIERSYEKGPRVAEAVYNRYDRYVVRRKNGQAVVEWTVCNPNESRSHKHTE